MDRLPSELYLEIFLNFRYSEPFPRYFWDPFRRDSLEDFLASFQGRPDIKTLRNLRLVSTTCHGAATSILLRSIRIRCKPLDGDAPMPNAILDSLLGPRPRLVPYLKELQLGFLNYEVDSGFLLNHTHSSISDKNAIMHIIEPIPRLLDILSHLESFQILMPKWTSHYTGGEEDGTAPQLDLNLLSIFRTTLSSALPTAIFANLTTLRLSLPCTYDFVQMAAALSDSVLANLKTLFLGVTDATGPGGAKEYLWWADENGDGDDGFPYSNLQLQYPNIEYMEGIFSIVSRCRNLESLGLEGTQLLEANLLDWLPESRGLRNLYLNRIKLDASKAIALLSPNESLSVKKSRLSKIWLEFVELTSGCWEEIFKHLLLCPELQFVNLEDLSYARGSPDFDSKVWLSRPWEDSQNLLSTRVKDHEALLALTHYLIKNAGGRDAYVEKFGTRHGLQPEY